MTVINIFFFQSEEEPAKMFWLNYLTEGEKLLKFDSGQDFSRPSSESDKLYMCIGERAIIEVAHPVPVDGENKYVLLVKFIFLVRFLLNI